MQNASPCFALTDCRRMCYGRRRGNILFFAAVAGGSGASLVLGERDTLCIEKPSDPTACPVLPCIGAVTGIHGVNDNTGGDAVN